MIVPKSAWHFALGVTLALASAACSKVIVVSPPDASDAATVDAADDAASDASASDASASDASASDASATDAALACPYVGPPLVDPSIFAPCSPVCGGAHCLPESFVPPANRAALATCSTSTGAGYCVPDTAIVSGGNAVPATCSPIPGTPAEGRCLSDCLPFVGAAASTLVVDVCASGEHCVPCFDPFTGAATGVCSAVACDMPALPAYTFATCCPSAGTDTATCLPASTIPAATQSALAQRTCPSSFLCVPDEYVPGSGVAVSTCGTSRAPATCVSRCLVGVPANLPQGSCPPEHACLPCRFAPAGTPGCP